jgi:hypothetical protein
MLKARTDTMEIAKDTKYRRNVIAKHKRNTANREVSRKFKLDKLQAIVGLPQNEMNQFVKWAFSDKFHKIRFHELNRFSVMELPAGTFNENMVWLAGQFGQLQS